MSAGCRDRPSVLGPVLSERGELEPAGRDVMRQHSVVETVRESHHPADPVPWERPAARDAATPALRTVLANLLLLLGALLAVIGAVTVALLAVRVWGWLA